MPGPIVLITGGGGAIGLACARLYAEDGSRVVAADINLEAAQKVVQGLKGGPHLAVKVDVGCEHSVQGLADEILARYGGQAPKIVIHSAGVVGNHEGLSSSSNEVWDSTIRINLRGTFLINKVFVTLMAKQGIKGSVVNLSSAAAYGMPRTPDYSASKAGVIGLTKAIAKEFGKKGIRVNAVTPTYLKDSTMGMASSTMAKDAPNWIVELTAKLAPLKRTGTVEEVADLCYFLASDKASFITGDVHHITGGFFG